MKNLSLFLLLSLLWFGADGLSATCSVPANSGLTDLTEECALKMCGIHNSGSLPLERDIELYDELKFVLQVGGAQEEFHLALTTERALGTPQELFTIKIVWATHDVYFNADHYAPWSDSNTFPFNPLITLQWDISIRFMANNKIVITVSDDQGNVYEADYIANVEGAHDVYYHGQNSHTCDCIRLIGLIHRCNTLPPTRAPSYSPTKSPTRYPTKSPTYYPTKYPSYSPTKSPSHSPTKFPSSSPTYSPSYSPTKAPLSRCYQSCYEFDTEICQITGTRRSNFDICGAHTDLDVAVLKMSQSNHMYGHCDSSCVYDFNNIDSRAWRWNEELTCFDMVDGTDHECYVINNDDWHQVGYISGHICSDCFDMVYDIDSNPCDPIYDAKRKTIINCETLEPDLNIYLAQANEYYPTCSSECLYRYPDKYIYKFTSVIIDGQSINCYEAIGDSEFSDCSTPAAIFDMDVHQADVCNYDPPADEDFCQLLIYSSPDFSVLMSPPGASGFDVGSYDCCSTNDFNNDELDAVRLIGSNRCRFRLDDAASDHEHTGQFFECTYSDGPGDYDLQTLIDRGNCQGGNGVFAPNTVSHIEVYMEPSSENAKTTKTNTATIASKNFSNGFKLVVISFLFIIIGLALAYKISKNNNQKKTHFDASTVNKLVNEYTPLMEMA